MNEAAIRLCEEILSGIRKGEINRENLNKVKSRIASVVRIELPSNEDILELVPEDDDDRALFIRVLQRRPNRTASGISIDRKSVV